MTMSLEAIQPYDKEHSDEFKEPTRNDIRALEKEMHLLSSEPIGIDDIDPLDPIAMYFRDVPRRPLLTAQEEIQLSEIIKDGHNARMTLARTEGNLEIKQRMILKERIDQGLAAQDEIITTNLRLVISVAKKYMYRGVAFIDLIQAGNEGLIRGAKKFDYKRGYKFSTYVTWWIRQGVTHTIDSTSRTIRVPAGVSREIRKMIQEKDRLTQQLGREPTRGELAILMENDPKTILYRPVSTNTPIFDDSESELGDTLPDDNAIMPESTHEQSELRKSLETILMHLPSREARILKYRFGLVDGQAYTLEEVGHKFGVTRERVRQIEKKALESLRTPYITETLEAYRRGNN